MHGTYWLAHQILKKVSDVWSKYERIPFPGSQRDALWRKIKYVLYKQRLLIKSQEIITELLKYTTEGSSQHCNKRSLARHT
jgi:hypothetical protein